ncbi:FUN14 family protein [Nitzschia inconspicua]|uniref:FUN14 family protein n=1 Tax=Nitzschia inconspicua TaxID=303405 RepID=A0A9K3L593_9STRA|nr:FUN14 family protein [Nitzschia inconspicua]KAG7361436.1 FUN14 family protein [Nitzschia inconspicua]
MSSSDPVDVVKQYIEKNKDALSQISFGGVMGYCSGLAFRKASRFAAVIIGAGFMGLQGAKSLGYIEVDWNKIKDDAIKPLDANKDGKLDADDAQIWWQKSQVVLKDSIPGAGGFSAGFLLGARRG